MLTATIISSEDLTPLDVLDFDVYSIEKTIDYSGKCKIDVSRKPLVNDYDFIMIKNNAEIITLGLISKVENIDGENHHVIHFDEIESLFDRDIFLENEKVKQEHGVEDFIAQCINNNFVRSEDDFVNKTYIVVNAETHTPVFRAVEHDNGIFNLKTYLGNVLEWYGVGLKFRFTRGKLEINIYKRDNTPLKINMLVSDIVNYSEVYETNVMSKLTAKWKIPDVTDENENVIVGETTIHNFYLLANRSVTTDMQDENRAKGTIKTMYFEFETYAELLENVTQEFKNNSYNHSVTADIVKSSRIFPVSELFVGNEAIIKTTSHGVKNSIVTRVYLTDTSQYINVKFGNLKITLLEKIRKGKKND